MKKIRRVFWLLFLSALLFLSGCGTNTKNDDGNSDEPVVLRVADGAEPVTFDIQATNDIPTVRISKQIYETLIFQTSELGLEPGLATEWEEVEENLFEFKLRENVIFHNGEKFTADDVAYTFKRAIESPAIGHIVESIDPETIEVIDEHTIQIGTYETFGPFLTHLAHPTVAILNEKAVEEAGDEYGTDIVVGTGPFEFEEWITGTQVIANRFEDYWGEEPEIDTIEFNIIADSSVRLIELESDAIDIAYDIASSDLKAVEENDELTLINTPNLGAEYLGLSVHNDTPLREKKVRQAIAHVIDVPSIINTVYEGVGEQMSGPISELVFGFNDELDPIEYNVDQAKDLLAEAGYPDGGFTLSLYVGDSNPQRIQVSQIISEALAEIGIDVEIVQMEWGAFLEATALGEPDMFLLGWITATADADQGLYPLFHSNNVGEAGNRSFYENDHVDELLDQGKSTMDEDKRLEYYKEAQEIIHDEVPWVFLQTLENVTAINNRVHGFEHYPTGHYVFSPVTLDKE